MALLKVYKFPEPVLKQVAEPVTTFDAELKTLADNMLETMYHSNGIGLAANQIGVLQRILVMDVKSGTEEEPRIHVFVNPEIIEKTGEIIYEEGCLSVVEFTAEVQRAGQVRVRYQDLEGTTQEAELSGLESVCVQHELDHLNGILFIDHLPPLKQKMVKKKLIKRSKWAA